MKNETPKIERGIPIPGRSVRGRYAFLANMKVGESVLMDNYPAAQNAGANYFGKGNYATAIEGNKVRLWRRA